MTRQRLGTNDAASEVEEQTFRRATLEQHWNRLATQRALRRRKWDAVVLQEQGTQPLTNPESMAKAIALWVLQIRSAGAEPVLFLPWRRREHLDDDDAWGRIRSLHYAAAREWNIRPAAVGDVWTAFRRSHPDIALTAEGGNHVNETGAVLSASVIVATIVDWPDPGGRLRQLIQEGGLADFPFDAS
ncbi:hypothetical protein C0Z17_16860 [Trinickia caryophylli]|nr:hypothetical protein C0Z17_16860 [Trinickia caryophylli]